MKKSKVLVFSIALGGYGDLYGSCIETIKEYSQRHDYDFELINSSPRELLPIEAAWLKLPLIVAALKKGYEWVAFIDSDIDIRPFTPPFDQQLNKEDTNKSIFISTGKSGRLNSGVIFVKNTAESLSFFEHIIEKCDLMVPEEDRTAFENGHIIHYGKTSNEIFILDHDMWNNNSKLNPDSYVQHYSDGNLRDWYFENRVGKKSFFSVLKTKLLKPFKHRKTAKLKRTRPEKLSLSIAELIPYYTKTFDKFK